MHASEDMSETLTSDMPENIDRMQNLMESVSSVIDSDTEFSSAGHGCLEETVKSLFHSPKENPRHRTRRVPVAATRISNLVEKYS